MFIRDGNGPGRTFLDRGANEPKGSEIGFKSNQKNKNWSFDKFLYKFPFFNRKSETVSGGFAPEPFIIQIIK